MMSFEVVQDPASHRHRMRRRRRGPFRVHTPYPSRLLKNDVAGFSEEASVWLGARREQPGGL